MAIQSSGVISFSDVQGEFGGSHPISLTEYYGADTGVPASGTISLSDFYGKAYILGPYSHSWGQHSLEGNATYTFVTLTNLTQSQVRVWGNVSATNPTTSQIVLDRSTNNGGSWGNSVTIATVTHYDQGTGGTNSSGDQTVSLAGYNAIRVRHNVIGQHAYAVSVASGVYVSFP